MPPSDYDLKIDEQTEHFLSSKQQLTYFLVTAAIVPIGFTMALVDRREVDIDHWLAWALLSAGVAVGLVVAGAAISAIHLEHRSHRKHIESRYEGKSYTDLAAPDQQKWDTINSWAAGLLTTAFVLLPLEMPLLAVFLAVFVIS